MTIIICIPHFSRADFMQLKRLLEKKTMCFHTAFPTEILRAPSLHAYTACLIPHISCKPSKAENKISNKISKANLVGLRFNSIMFPLACVVYSTTQGKHLFSLFSGMFYYPDNSAHIHLFCKKFHA